MRTVTRYVAIACISSGAVVLPICTTVVAAPADMFAYWTLGEQFGAAMIATFARREMVRRTTDYCAEAFADIKDNSRQAFVVWVRRQSGYLVLADAMRAHLRNKANTSINPELAKQWRILLDETLPKTVQLSGRMAVMALEEGPGTPEVKRDLCLKFNANAISGAMDLEQSDPVNAKYLQDGLKSPRETAPADPMGDLGAIGGTPRLEAAALLGRWTLVRAKMYRLDGTVSGPPGSCTTEFSSERFVSECVTAGRTLRVGFSYRIIAPGRYQAELVENPGVPSTIGSRVESMFRLDGDELLIVTFPPVAPNAWETSPIKTEAVLKREAQ